jgi:hypothetical protein
LKGSGRLCTQAGRSRQHLRFLPPLPACLPAIHAAAPAHLPTELRCNIKRRLWLCLWLWLSPALVPAPPLHSTPPLLPSRTPAATAMGRHPTPGAQRRHCTAWRDRVPVCPSRAAHRAPFSPALDSAPTPTPFCSSSTSSPLRELDDTQSERERGRGAADPGAELLYLPVLVGAEARSSSCSPVLPATVGLPPSPCS